MITAEQLRQVMPRLSPAKLQTYLPFLNEAMARFAIETPLRAAAFLAQLAHESAEFRFMEEIWGPTPAQRRYEPPDRLAARLGNTETGDGFRFKGRGPIQITGRSNYARYGVLLGLDLIADPAQAATPAVGFATAGLYWTSHKLNDLADAEDFVGITRRINGGINGLPDRQKYYERAKAILIGGFVATPVPTTRGRSRATAPAVPLDLEPLSRGFEAIAAIRTGRGSRTTVAVTRAVKPATGRSSVEKKR